MKKPLIKKIDRVFSKLIRLRDTKDGYGKCCSCGSMKLYAELDCGHFINRKWMPTRWHEQNCHAQCRSCNRFSEGNSAGYSLFMIDKYGRDHLEYLSALSRETARFSDSDGELMLLDFKRKVKELKQRDKIK